MLIGQLAHDLGLNTKTIRYYEAIGLLPAPPRTGGGFRVYGEADRDRLAFIGKAKSLDLSLNDIAQLLSIRSSGLAPCPQVLGMVSHKITLLDEQIDRLTAFRDDLRRLLDQPVPASCQGQVCDIVEGFEMKNASPRLSGLALPDVYRQV